MKLIILSGPPVSGKLTVAKELSKITNFKIFHNHATIDIMTSFMEFGKGDFWKEVHKLRLQILELAAKKRAKLIFTWCYAGKPDDKNLNNMISKIKKHNGEVLFVQLRPSVETLRSRVKENSRKSYGKLSSVKILNKALKEHEYYSKIPHKKNLEIDNTKLSAKKVAKIIKEHYNLK